MVNIFGSKDSYHLSVIYFFNNSYKIIFLKNSLIWDHIDTVSEESSGILNNLIPWPNWKRTFFPDRLAIHLKSWKPNNHLKKNAGKKSVYQPPKLKNKTKWQAPKEEDNESNENMSPNPVYSQKHGKTHTIEYDGSKYLYLCVLIAIKFDEM